MNIGKIDKNMLDDKKNEIGTIWYGRPDIDYSVHGLYWFKENNSYCRLKEDTFVSDNVSQLSYHPSGAYLAFMTNTTSISLRVSLSSAAYMSHMSACGQCGLDLYFLNKDNYVFLATTKINKAEYEITIISGMSKKMREYRLYLPIYTKLISIEIGIDSDANINKCEDFKPEAIVCYGTSITQGGCATRPGMNYSSILGRHLNYEIYNLGFSGSAKLEENMAYQISLIKEMKYLIIEAEANSGYSDILENRLKAFLDIIVKSSKTDIFIISHYPRPDTLIKSDIRKKLQKNALFQKNICSLYKNVSFVDGKKLLRSYQFEETVDGTHLTDLGFFAVAKFFIKLIEKKGN
ncbi:MAG: SGNH/GDSL hydrolase family protein [Bacilli bacterium]|nr:SGNH/GDSL hydrolase family protein [Bacilli bacterium]